jgi:molybdopterin synthase catalytic subunit
MIRIQNEAFDAGAELKAFSAALAGVGATAMFVGSVRSERDGRAISAMTLEHYPGMTERALKDIETEALRRWPIEQILIIHRYGRLEPGDDIVLVITASAHRQAAFAACEFLMDWLKTKAPFWKLEEGPSGADWVEAKASDDAAAARWGAAGR